MKAHFACFYTLLTIGLVFEKRLKLAFSNERQRVVETGEKILDIWSTVTKTSDKVAKIGRTIWQGEPRDHRGGIFRRMHQKCPNGLGSQVRVFRPNKRRKACRQCGRRAGITKARQSVASGAVVARAQER